MRIGGPDHRLHRTRTAGQRRCTASGPDSGCSHVMQAGERQALHTPQSWRTGAELELTRAWWLLVTARFWQACGVRPGCWWPCACCWGHSTSARAAPPRTLRMTCSPSGLARRYRAARPSGTLLVNDVLAGIGPLSTPASGTLGLRAGTCGGCASRSPCPWPPMALDCWTSTAVLRRIGVYLIADRPCRNPGHAGQPATTRRPLLTARTPCH